MTHGNSSEFQSTSPQGETLPPLEAYHAWQNEGNAISEAHARQVVGLVMHALDQKEQIHTQNELITEQEATIEDAIYSSEHDSLTGLLNTGALQRDLEARMQLGTPVVVHYLDLDRFKAVNDVLGHDRGNDVLVALSEKLRSRLQRGTDVIAHDRVPESLGRRGGDEFAIVSNLFDQAAIPEHEDDTDRRQGETVEERVGSETEYLQNTLDEFVAEQPDDVRALGFGVSVGTAYWDPEAEPGMTAEKLIRRADLLMYGRKNLRFGPIIERHRDELELVFSILAGIGVSARDLPKLDPQNYTHRSDEENSGNI